MNNQSLSVKQTLQRRVQTLAIVSGLTALTACAAVDEQPPAIAGKFAPADGRALLVIGQDTDTLTDYHRDVPEDTIEAFTLYTTIKSATTADTLDAVFKRDNWGAGDVDFAATFEMFPNSHIAIGVAYDYCNDTNHTEAVAAGDYDKPVKAFAKYIQSLAPRKAFIRLGYEFDGLWNCYEPESYKTAFKRIVDTFKAEGVSNAAFVWQSAVWPMPELAGEQAHLYDNLKPDHFARWYPGDAYVDYVGVSSFYRDFRQWPKVLDQHPADLQQRLLDYARSVNKPVMISEAAPQAYDIAQGKLGHIFANTTQDVTAEQIWQHWFVPFIEFVDQNSDIVRVVSYINANWHSQPMWYCEAGHSAGTERCPKGYWGDSRVQANPLIKSRWLNFTNDDSRFVQSTEYEY